MKKCIASSIVVRTAAFVAAVSAFQSLAAAADLDFIGPSGSPASWHVGSNWAGGVVPGGGDVVYFKDNRIGEVTEDASIGVVRLGPGGGEVGEVRINAGTLTANNNFYVGADGLGTLALNGGTLVSSRLESAVGGASTGTITLNSGALTVNGETYLGLRGLTTVNVASGTMYSYRFQVGQENEPNARAIVNQTGGTITARDVIVLGEQSRNDNQWNISAGVTNTPEVYNGANGGGTINLSGSGEMNIIGQLHCGAGGTGDGKLIVSGGTLNMTGPNGWILVGQNGLGTATISGGAINTKIISVGQDPTSTGTGTQTGGAIRSEYTFIVGEASANNNTYSISGGSLDVGTTGLPDDGSGIFVGSYAGKGTLTISGTASVTTANPILIGAAWGGSFADGTLDLQAGTLGTTGAGSAGMVRIGYLAGSTGRYLQSGGTATFTGPVINQISGIGSVAISGGSFAAPSFENNGTHSQSGGTASYGAVTGAGTMSVSGGTATVTRLTQSSLSVTASGSLTIVNAAVPEASLVASVSTGGNGVLDLTNNGLIVDYTGESSPIAAIRTSLAGGDIVATLTPADSRTAVAYGEASSLGLAAFMGTPVDSTSIVLRARLKGDTNFSGDVGFDDLLTLAQNYDVIGTAVWTEGDFNYDGTVGFDDLLSLAQNYSASIVASQLPAGISPQFNSDWQLAQSMVPEPTMLAGLASCLLFGRRRR